MASVVSSEQQLAADEVLYEPIIYLGSPPQTEVQLTSKLPDAQPVEQQNKPQAQELQCKEQQQEPQERKATSDRPHSHRTVPQGNNCVFFAKVPPFVQEEQLLELFRRCGAVVGINLYRSWATTKKSKGCGIVEFQTAEGAAAALDQLNGAHLWPECPGPMVVEHLHRGRPVMLPSTLKTHPRFGPNAQAGLTKGAPNGAAAAGTRAKQPVTVARYMPMASEQQEAQQQQQQLQLHDPPGLAGSGYRPGSSASSSSTRYQPAHTSLAGQAQEEGGHPPLLTLPQQQQQSFLYSPDSAAASFQAMALQQPPQAPPGLQYIAVPAGMSVQVTLQPQVSHQTGPTTAYVLQAPMAPTQQQVVTIPAAPPGASFLYTSGASLMPQVLGDGSSLTVLGGGPMQPLDLQQHHHQQQQQQAYMALPGGMTMLQAGAGTPQLLQVSQPGVQHQVVTSPEPQQVLMVSRGDPSLQLNGTSPWLMAMPQMPMGLNGGAGGAGQQVVVLGQPGQG